MAKIRFETGQVVNFDGQPTKRDVEEVANRLGIKKEGVKGLGGVAVGAAKSFAEGITSTAGLLQTGGQRFLGAITPGKTFQDIRKETGISALEKETPEAERLRGKLERRGRAEKVGAGIETAAEFLLPLGLARKTKVAKETFEAVSKPVLRRLKKEKVPTKLEPIRKKVVLQDAVEITKPTLSKRESIQALAKGEGVEKGLPLFKKVEIKPRKRDVQVAESVQDIVSKTRNEVQNISAVRDKIGTVGSQIQQGVRQHNAIFNTNQLRSKLEKAREKSRVLFGTDKTLQSRYDAVIDEMMTNIKKKDLDGLYQARKDFDRIVREKFPRVFDGSPSDNVTKNAILDVRREVNDFIANTLPKGNKFKKQLQQESRMFEAAENIAEQAFLKVPTPTRGNFLNRALSAIGFGIAGAAGTSVIRR